MISLAHNLGLEIVAEGVETEEQLRGLKQFGAHQVQGFLISQPLPLEELAAFLAEKARAPVQSRQ
jgi:EAL domain-containing protein (putative c-di-GMP-specific phosphodiesterase class I)